MATERIDTELPGAGSQVESARRVLENLAELEPELRGAAIYSGNGPARRLLAARDGDEEWATVASELADAVEAAAVESFDSAHIALNEGEIFVVAEAGFTLVASTGRFVLASLTGFDMRMSLRDLAGAHGPAGEKA
ncbi:MAG: hypothetical protein M3Y45_03850 [Actinomycetota bacterium]|nr:hypothetical protein [Actinomycetota bacterium]